MSPSKAKSVKCVQTVKSVIVDDGWYSGSVGFAKYSPKDLWGVPCTDPPSDIFDGF